MKTEQKTQMDGGTTRFASASWLAVTIVQYAGMKAWRAMFLPSLWEKKNIYILPIRGGRVPDDVVRSIWRIQDEVGDGKLCKGYLSTLVPSVKKRRMVLIWFFFMHMGCVMHGWGTRLRARVKQKVIEGKSACVSSRYLMLLKRTSTAHREIACYISVWSHFAHSCVSRERLKKSRYERVEWDSA